LILHARNKNHVKHLHILVQGILFIQTRKFSTHTIYIYTYIHFHSVIISISDESQGDPTLKVISPSSSSRFLDIPYSNDPSDY